MRQYKSTIGRKIKNWSSLFFGREEKDYMHLPSELTMLIERTGNLLKQ